MALFTTTQPAATAVGVNHINTMPEISTSPRPRVLRGAGFVGSATLGDAGVDVKVGYATLVRLYTSRAGVTTPNKDDLMPVGEVIPPNTVLSAPIFDAGATNPTFLILDIVTL